MGGTAAPIKSKIWGQRHEDILKNPYDYKGQEIFLDEAQKVLDKAFEYYDKFLLRFHKDDRSAKKAVWMLHLDALDSLRDCVLLMREKKHRIVGKMFRDIIEVLDLAAFFWWTRESRSKQLDKWYLGEVIPHREFRNYLKSTKGKVISRQASDIYERLSKWTHHCYPTLLNSYSIAGHNGEMLVYDSHSTLLILPQTVSQYIWQVKDIILYFLSNVKDVGLIDWKEYSAFLNETVGGLKFR